VQTRVINSGTHLRIHTAELRGLRDNEISRTNYTGKRRASLLAERLARRADFPLREERERTSSDRYHQRHVKEINING